jgi:ribosome-associated protein
VPGRETITVGPVPAGTHLIVSRSCRIPLDELEWRFSASGGPGGQHANTSNTRAEVRFDVAGSPSLGPRQRARLLERVGPTVRVVASDERSQARNRELAPPLGRPRPPGRQAAAVGDQAAAGPPRRRLTKAEMRYLSRLNYQP